MLSFVFLIVISFLSSGVWSQNTEESTVQSVPNRPSTPEPSKPEPSQPEPSQPEPSQPEPSQPEPSQPEPSKPEPSKPEPRGATCWNSLGKCMDICDEQSTRKIDYNCEDLNTCCVPKRIVIPINSIDNQTEKLGGQQCALGNGKCHIKCMPPTTVYQGSVNECPLRYFCCINNPSKSGSVDSTSNSNQESSEPNSEPNPEPNSGTTSNPMSKSTPKGKPGSKKSNTTEMPFYDLPL